MKFEVAVLGSPSLIVLIIYYLCGRKATLNWSYIAQVRTIHKPAYLPTYLPTYLSSNRIVNLHGASP